MWNLISLFQISFLWCILFVSVISQVDILSIDDKQHFYLTGLHVVVIMFTGYLVGFVAFRALFNHSSVMVTTESTIILTIHFRSNNSLLKDFRGHAHFEANV